MVRFSFFSRDLNQSNMLIMSHGLFSYSMVDRSGMPELVSDRGLFVVKSTSRSELIKCFTDLK